MEKKEAYVLGKATDADLGSWVASTDGSVFVRSREIILFRLVEDEDGGHGIAAHLTSDDWILVASGMTDVEAAHELISMVS